MSQEQNPFAPPSAPVGGPSAAGLPFKFKYLNANGQEVGFFAKKGVIEAGSVVLDGHGIPAAAIPT
ncbi:MAG: hypothetical protein U0835_04340 [Isosphaeraceae bacterium]